MRPTRPTSVLVIAILQLVFGGMLLICGICAGLMQLGGNQMLAGGQNAAQKDMQQEMEKFIEQRHPNAKSVGYVELALGYVAILLMIVSGIGLLRMTAWARVLALLFAAIALLHILIGVINGAMYQAPATREFVAAQRAKGDLNQEQTMFLSILDVMGTAWIVLPLVFAIYPIVVLIILLRPSVAAAFHGETAAPQIEDYYDDRTEQLDQP